MTAVGRARVSVDMSATVMLPVINAPTLKQNKVDDRNIPRQRVADDATDLLRDVLWPTGKLPDPDTASDAEIAATLGKTQRALDRELAVKVSRLLHRESTTDADRELLRSVLRRLTEATVTGQLAADVLALADHDRLTATAKLVAVKAVITYWSKPHLPCPDWCDDHYPNPDGDNYALHHGVLGEAADVEPDTGKRSAMSVELERIDRDGMPGDAYLLMQDVGESSVFVASPKGVLRLVKLLLKARRILRADRKAARAVRASWTALDRAVVAMSADELAAFGQAQQAEGDAR